MMPTILGQDYWRMAFELAVVQLHCDYVGEGIAEVVATDCDRDDEQTTITGIFTLKTGRYVFLRAGLHDHLPDWKIVSVVEVVEATTLASLLEESALANEFYHQSRRP